MKIIFLDIDGVLNTSRQGAPGGGPKPRLEKASIDAVNMIIEQIPDVRFVLSSRWRVDYGYDETINYLRSSGLKAIFIGQTPNFDRPETKNLKPRRFHEIKEYLERNGIKDKFVIIDDNPDLGRLSSRQIRTRWTTGFTSARVSYAIELLNR